MSAGERWPWDLWATYDVGGGLRPYALELRLMWAVDSSPDPRPCAAVEWAIGTPRAHSPVIAPGERHIRAWRTDVADAAVYVCRACAIADGLATEDPLRRLHAPAGRGRLGFARWTRQEAP